jgi:hypothetical protein
LISLGFQPQAWRDGRVGAPPINADFGDLPANPDLGALPINSDFEAPPVNPISEICRPTLAGALPARQP